ncbi:MAG: methyltransferase domain-containing protein [Proteobacteria bacterium]|nr:methyltransferase domain-containing protein [Pseudomonadota bacterium]MBU1387311.1 methyltransferase domain-containing protein [Pseudomonadota bacterium]MBU1544293.1 methyltransferase domain-containing protein [Pseudomonadota bacterium]MBU2430322.1 methyltransferase domain-containing protein [Pseudomonadota bacterium]MBU2481147.1 methyltransferase domain-containing protein [Pseudomonadota bacterium]
MSSLRIRYQTIEFDDIDIHVRTLRDSQQFCDDDGIAEKLGISSATWPLFGIVWDSSLVLAHFLSDFDILGKRILEVGCGIGLTSLLLNHRLADITATDYHPEANTFLLENIKLNKGRNIPFIRTGWADEESALGRFDLIIGSDLLYERNHAQLLSGFINQHANSSCEIIVVDPGRGNHAPFSKKMVTLGYSHTQSRPVTCAYLTTPFKGQILRYTR